MVDTKRKTGPKITKHNPRNTYDRNRQRYYNQLKKDKISIDEYNELMDKNLEEYKRDQKNTSLKDF